MTEPEDATKYTFDVSVFIDRRLDTAGASGNPSNSTKLNLDMEGAIKENDSFDPILHTLRFPFG